MCRRVTRSDVTRVYFQHMHVNVDTETPHRHARTCEETNAPSRTDGAVRNRACTLQQPLTEKKTYFRGLGPAFLHDALTVFYLPSSAGVYKKVRASRGSHAGGKERDRRDMQSRPLILIRGLSSLLSAAAVDHTGVTFTINLNAQNH